MRADTVGALAVLALFIVGVALTIADAIAKRRRSRGRWR